MTPSLQAWATMSSGNGGNDDIAVGRDDTIYGGQGDDVIEVFTDSSVLEDAITLFCGGVGSDSITVDGEGFGGDGDVTVYGYKGSADGADRADFITVGAGDELVYGNARRRHLR